MGIILVSKEEKFTAEIMGCEFYYRRIPADKREAIHKANTVRGVTDNEGVIRDGFEYALLGWGGEVPTINDEPAEFNLFNVTALPDPIKAKLTVNIFGTVGGEMVDTLDPLQI